MERTDKILFCTIIFGLGLLLGMILMIGVNADTSSEPVYETPRIRVRGDIYRDNPRQLQSGQTDYVVQPVVHVQLQAWGR